MILLCYAIIAFTVAFTLNQNNNKWKTGLGDFKQFWVGRNAMKYLAHRKLVHAKCIGLDINCWHELTNNNFRTLVLSLQCVIYC